MVTIYDLAKRTGFSSTTVSKALNNYTDVSQKTKQKILDAAAEMGYLPNAHAQSLSTKKSWTIGVMFAEDNEVGLKHPFFSALIESFRKYVEREGYDLIFASRNLRNRDTSYLEHFLYRAVDGIVVICSDPHDPQVQDMINSHLPIVVIDMSNQNCSVVYSDNIEGGRLAVKHLHSLGHTRIAHISGDPSIDAGAQRIKGFKKGMDEQHLPILDGYLVNGGMFSIEEGKAAMETLLELETIPTAVFVAGDHMAIGAMEAIKEKGLRIPEDISIIGYDDIEMSSYLTPKLTTVRQDTDRIGSRAGQLLMKQIIQKKKLLSTEVIPVELIIRESCTMVKKEKKK
ncbi:MULTISPECIES: LacI family DNA-binding transcriptional regulator [Rossellomorea]|uniref:LacI family DNA-binding transcriptional regulator n=1 Tax=Rossellomorea TaxID=2837508 RepID=UPI001E3F4241|nr:MULTISPECIES: LacI family DNA-binding transcriptional regulator [Rossellomorea]MCC5803720.1 LacI family DNA-binding transcriptional regulator [Rossellomorea vietnamensis]UTE78175.1 LacI family transcriptional regulator [Rossellomorea sp. KS-H15a]